MDTTPLLRVEAPSDASLSSPPPPCRPAVDDDAKNPDVSKNGAEGVDKKEDAGKEDRAWFRRWMVASLDGGMGATGAGAGSSGGKREHVLQIDAAPSSRSSAATPSSRIKVLIDSAQQFEEYCSSHVSLADPSAKLTAALRMFAAAPNASSAESLLEAAATVDKIAASGKLEEQATKVAMDLASEAMAFAAGGDQGADLPSDLAASTSNGSTCSRSPEVLFYIAMPSSLGLLPYLNATIPKHLHVAVAILFGTVFSGATVGALLIARGRDKTDTEVATIVGALTFTAFSLLVIVFVSFALAGGSLTFIGVLVAIVVLVHIVAWAKK